MRKVYTVLGALLLSAYSFAELTGWEMASNAKKGVVQGGARSAGGFRSYSFWGGGK